MKKKILLAVLLAIPMGAAFAKSEYIGMPEEFELEMEELVLTPTVEDEAKLGAQSATVSQQKSSAKSKLGNSNRANKIKEQP